MAADLFFSSTSSSSVLAGLFVAGLSAVYAYTQLGPGNETHTRNPSPNDLGGVHAQSSGQVDRNTTLTRPTRRAKQRSRKKGKGTPDEVGVRDGHADRDRVSNDVLTMDQGEGTVSLPGGFQGTVARTSGVDVGVVGVGATADAGQTASVTKTASQPTHSGKAKKGRKGPGKGKGEGEGKGKGDDEDKGKGKEDELGEEEGEDHEGGPETGKEVWFGRMPRSGNSTDASVSLPPSSLASARASSRTEEKGKLRSRARLAPSSEPHAQSGAHVPFQSQAQSQSRERIRPSPSLSFDTDSSWTYVGRRTKLSASGDGHRWQALAGAMDVVSSDLASTASDSPVAERMESDADVRGTRADLAPQTLAEKLVPRPNKTAVDDMLEQSGGPTLARVMRVQPHSGESPPPAFSWEDDGHIAIQDGDSLIVHDADQEDEGEWGVVTSRRRNRAQPTATMATTTTPSLTSSSHTTASTQTKKQRQNARKRELAKSAKAEAEAIRLQGLAKHKHELEQLRAIEQSQSRSR